MSGSTATRMFYGASYDAASDFGAVSTQFVDGVFRKTSTFISDLSTIKALGGRVMMKFPGPSGTHMDTSSNFSLAMWKSNMDACFNVNGSSAASRSATSTQIANFVADGTLMCNYMLDDFKSGSNIFNVVPTIVEIEACAAYSKSVWPSLPCMARAEGTYFKTIADAAGMSKYTSLDYGWCQWHKRFGDAFTYYQSSMADGRSVGLGMMLGINLLGGGSGLTIPWNVDNVGNWYGMSPQEIDACTAAASQLTLHLGCNVWADIDQYNPHDYWHFNSVETALDRLRNALLGRGSGPINWKTGSLKLWYPPGTGVADPRDSASTNSEPPTSPPGSGTGDWSFRAGGAFKTGGGPMQLDMPSQVFKDDFLGILAQSRDSSFRSFNLPSGWSTAKAISGNSAQGGQLVLVYKLAVGNEGGTTVTLSWSGAGGTGSSAQVKSFAISGNTNVMANLITNFGSSSTWGNGSSNMGPIKGPLTSTYSGPFCLICAGKTRGVGSNPAVDGSMSATTAATGESWVRGFQEFNGTGDDQYFFLDYANLTGIASVVTKSYSQLTNINSLTTGAGAGFMLFLAPALVSAGVPPVLTDLEDTTFSIASTLAFTMSSTGSTPLTYSKNSAPSNMTVNSSTGAVTWTPLSAGTYYILLQAQNSYGTDIDDFTATVTAASNVAPVITHPGDKTVNVGESLNFVIAASDANSDPLAYSMDGSLTGMTLGASSGNFVWTPTDDQGPATVPIVVNVTDGQATSHSTFTITVTNTPDSTAGNTWTRGDPDSGCRFTRFRY